ncbi:MAG: YitT family protein [Tractidigestivibacter sp.]|jgi:uncharacterized membrane-anchored protein YitT (DUF2179 family)|uniref:YitT family protein n=1 Tax=Tractidigestivibacter sp. TaxID=2847320 RepID=UPI003D94EF9C
MRIAPRWVRAARDGAMIVLGCIIFAVGFDVFEARTGLAAGGVTGLAMVIREVGLLFGIDLPVGIQTIVMNVLLLIPVIRTGDKRYAAKTLLGIIVLGFAVDALEPVLPPIGENDLLLCCLWGGVVTGFGLGLVFRVGGNTGGTDIIAQFIARKTGIPMGSSMIAVDACIIAASICVFSIEQALYATVALYISGRVLDAVVDGPSTQRAAYVISTHHEEIARKIMRELDRGCTEFEAKGMWSGERRPVLFCVLGRSETAQLKDIVAEEDPDAIVVISEIHEAFGEGFKRIDS